MYGLESDAVLDNLREIKVSRVSVTERALGHIGELALILCDSAGDDEIFFRDRDFIDAYRKITAYGSVPVSAGASADGIKRTETAFSAFEKAFLCRKITDNLGITGLQGIETFIDEDEFSDNTSVCYLRSAYSDDAYLKFSKYIDSPKAMYSESFPGVCGNVAGGVCGYCIIPTATANDGTLPGFNTLAAKYGLKKNLVCRIKTGEGDFTEFTLFRKNVTPPKSGNSRLEINIVPKSLGELINAADACGLKTAEIHSSAGEKDEINITFEISDTGICGFLAYLNLEYDSFDITGFYDVI